jgi:hypothetical protein
MGCQLKKLTAFRLPLSEKQKTKNEQRSSNYNHLTTNNEQS